MTPYPAFNGKTINKPGGETERLIGMQFWSLNQQKLTLLVLCFMHICVYEITIDCFNYMRGWTMVLSQLMCYSESTFVKIIQVVSDVKKTKKQKTFSDSYPTADWNIAVVQPLHETMVVNTKPYQTTKLYSDPYLWTQAWGSDHKKEFMDRRCWN